MVHFIGTGAGSGAGTTLDAEPDALTTGDTTNLINECISFCFYFHNPPVLLDTVLMIPLRLNAYKGPPFRTNKNGRSITPL